MGIQMKLCVTQKELKANKNQYNSFGKYNYRSCEDILEALKPILAMNQLTIKLSDQVVQIGGRIYVQSTATVTDAETGESESVTAFAREEETKKGMDASQVTGAASSYARKYALNGLFAIDDCKDSDATNTHENTKHCVDCGHVITGVTLKNGDFKTESEVINRAYEKHSRILCYDCQQRIEKGNKNA